jgi:membrane protease YdiL (CAAX protease family)
MDRRAAVLNQSKGFVEASNGFAMAVVVEGAIALIALLLAWFFHVPLREKIPPFGRPLFEAIGRGVLATLPMLVLFWWLVNSKLAALKQLRSQVEWLVREMFPDGDLGQFAMVAALAGVGEELLFRGVVQMKASDWTTPAFGLVIASFLFGVAHALSKVYLLFAIGVGAFFGWMAFKYNDLVGPMVAHGLYDFLALTYLARSESRSTPPRNDEQNRTIDDSNATS